MEAFGGGMLPRTPCDKRDLVSHRPRPRQATNFEMVGQNLSFTHPLWTDAVNAWSLSGGVGNRIIDTDAVLPDAEGPVPTELWNVNLGLRYSRQLGDGWTTSGGVSVGSASDHPFANIGVMNVGMNAMLRIPQGENNAWIFSLCTRPPGS